MTRFMLNTNSDRFSDKDKEELDEEVQKIKEQGFVSIGGKQYKIKN